MEGQDEVSAREQHFHSQVRESTVRGRAVPWCCAARWTQERSADQHDPIASSRTPSRTPAFQRPTGSAADRFSLRPLSPATPVTCSPSPHLCHLLACHPTALSSYRSPSRHQLSLPSFLSSLYLCSLPSPSLSLSRHLYTPPPYLCPPSAESLWSPVPLSFPELPPIISVSFQSPVPTSFHLLSRLFHHWQPFPSSYPPFPLHPQSPTLNPCPFLLYSPYASIQLICTFITFTIFT